MAEGLIGGLAGLSLTITNVADNGRGLSWRKAQMGGQCSVSICSEFVAINGPIIETQRGVQNCRDIVADRRAK